MDYTSNERSIGKIKYNSMLLIFPVFSIFTVFTKYIFPSLLINFYYHVVLLLRSSHHRCSMKKGFLRNFTKFTGKHLCQKLFFNKVTDLRPATLFKKGLWHSCFPVNFAKFLRTPDGDCFWLLLFRNGIIYQKSLI